MHHSAISRVLIHNDILVIIGEDLVMNKLRIVSANELKLVESRTLEKLVSLLFEVEGKMYVTFYEYPVITPIWTLIWIAKFLS